MFDRQSIHIALLLWGCIFSLIAALCMFMNKNFEREKKRWMLYMLLTCATLLFSDACAWGYRGGTGEAAFYMVRISNFLVFFMSDVLLLFFHGYVCCQLFEQKPQSKRTMYSYLARDEEQLPMLRIKSVFLIAMAGALVVLISQFTHWYYYIDAQNFYHRNSAFFISLVIPFSGMLLDLSLMLQYRKNVSRNILVSMVSYLVLPIVAVVIQTFYYGISLINIAISISMLMMFIEAIVDQGRKLTNQEKKLIRQDLELATQERQLAQQSLELARQERRLAEQERKLAKQNTELTERRIASMKSQIRTHFIFNVLGSISTYCKIDPAKADEALTRFARYLRRNMRYMEETGLIPFQEEMKQLQDYVALEQMRFQDLVEYGEDLEVTDFLIPPLTVQPLVENAIKHGLAEHGRKGMVCVFTRKEADAVVIEIMDNGAGFLMDELEKSDSLGIQNVRYRLEHMVGGTLKYESTLGEGTKAIIRIPAEREEHA